MLIPEYNFISPSVIANIAANFNDDVVVDNDVISDYFNAFITNFNSSFGYTLPKISVDEVATTYPYVTDNYLLPAFKNYILWVVARKEEDYNNPVPEQLKDEYLIKRAEMVHDPIISKYKQQNEDGTPHLRIYKV